MFSGQGSQYANMARGIYDAEPAFRSTVDTCARVLHPHLGVDLRALIFPAEENTEEATLQLQQTAIAQPALLVIEYALAQLFLSWGVRPRAMIGHSIGEYAAACLAGVLSLEDALGLVAARGRLVQDLPGGAMLSVPLAEADVLPLLGPDLAVAAVNAPGFCVVSGSSEAVDALQRLLGERGVDTRRLFTSHAFHSAMMEPASAAFADRVAKVLLRPPAVPFVSNVTGDWITAAQATDPAYWARHLRATVRFGDGIRRLLQNRDAVLLELGPGQTMATLVRQHPARDSARAILSSVRHPHQTQPDMSVLLGALGQLWVAGVPVDWKARSREPAPRRVPLPTYPFERRRYWLDRTAARTVEPAATPAPGPLRPATASVQYTVPVWQQQPLASSGMTATSDVAESWLVFLDDQGLGERICACLGAAGRRVRRVRPGAAFRRLDADSYTVGPASRADYAALLDAVRSEPETLRGIVHCWNITAPDRVASLEALSQHEERAFYSLLALVQAADGRLAGQPLKLVVVSNEMQDVTGDEEICPAKALLLGVTKVVPMELPSIACQSVDVALSSPNGAAADDLAIRIADEALGGALEGMVAYRGRHRWIQTLMPIEVSEPRGQRMVRAGGTYLITGGLGGIALELADELARHAPIQLALVGRSAFPAPVAWDSWLAEHDADDPVSVRIRAVRALESRGSRVMVASVDVSQLEEMRAVLQQVRARFGAIHGVIHAAGTGDYGMLVLRQPEQVARILAAKVRGTLVLDHLLAGDPLDFFASCSSINAVLPTVGQIDYAAASAFLDAFARGAATRSSCRHIAMNWDTWREVGMAVVTEVRPALRGARDEAVQRGLLSSQGRAAFDALLHARLAQALVTSKASAPHIARLATSPLAEPPLARPAVAAVTHARRERPELGSRYVAPQTETQGRIVQIWEELLGIEPVGIQDDFFELGGHSLLAIQLVSRVGKAFGVSVPLRTLFDTSRIEELALHVDNLRPPSAVGEREEIVL
jgi:acyl transferase domain-containing protein